MVTLRLAFCAVAVISLTCSASAQTLETTVAEHFRERGEIARKLEDDALNHFLRAALCTELSRDPTIRADAEDLLYRVHMGLYGDAGRAAAIVQVTKTEFDRAYPENKRKLDAQIAAGGLTEDVVIESACQDGRADRLLAIRDRRATPN